MSDSSLKQSNRSTTRRLGLIVVAMFGFGYALVPLYEVMCEIIGLNGKTAGKAESTEIQSYVVDTDRWVTVEFTGTTMQGLAWDFEPLTRKLRVNPGQPTTIYYLAHNRSSTSVAAQAVPSVSPGRAASHFKKIECFCFSRQELKPGESRKMPVRFVVDPKLAKNISTVTLSYSFFAIDDKKPAPQANLKTSLNPNAKL